MVKLVMVVMYGLVARALAVSSLCRCSCIDEQSRIFECRLTGLSRSYAGLSNVNETTSLLEIGCVPESLKGIVW